MTPVDFGRRAVFYISRNDTPQHFLLLRFNVFTYFATMHQSLPTRHFDSPRRTGEAEANCMEENDNKGLYGDDPKTTPIWRNTVIQGHA